MEVQKTPINLDFLKPDKSFIYPLYSETGERILEPRVVLTAEKIRDIRQKHGNIIFYINTIDAPGILKQSIEKAVNMSRELMQEIMQSDRMSRESYSRSEIIIDSMVGELNQSDLFALSLLKELKSYEEYLYHHSVNVGILSALLAKKTGKFEKGDLKDVALGAYLIDIGQMKIDNQLLKHTGPYSITERDRMKRHPQLGYELLRQITGVHPIVSQTVLFHHERYNDAGYFGLPYENLPLAPKIASLCDVFDAMTSQRPYRKAYSVSYTLKHLINSIATDFGNDLVSLFINHLGCTLNNNQNFFLPGDFCELSTNELAVIRDFGKHDTMKPIVVTFARCRRIKSELTINFYRRPIEIDLQMDPDRSITRFITGTSQIESLRHSLQKKKLLPEYLEDQSSLM